MNETTVRGNIVTDPSSRRVGDDPVFSFRVASNSRYQDRDTGEWKNGSTLYFTATCWGRLAEKAGGRLVKGDAVIVSGRLLTNEYERDGMLRRDLEMRVATLGPDMARMDVTVRRPRSQEGPQATGSDHTEAGHSGVDHTDSDHTLSGDAAYDEDANLLGSEDASGKEGPDAAEEQLDQFVGAAGS